MNRFVTVNEPELAQRKNAINRWLSMVFTCTAEYQPLASISTSACASALSVFSGRAFLASEARRASMQI